MATLLSVYGNIFFHQCKFHPDLAENIAPDGAPEVTSISLYYDLHSHDVTSWAPMGCNILC